MYAHHDLPLFLIHCTHQESVFFAAEALTAFQWGWLSDRFGRRMVLILGPLGLSFAMVAFGCSTAYWSMILARCLQGICNGNIGKFPRFDFIEVVA